MKTLITVMMLFCMALAAGPAAARGGGHGGGGVHFSFGLPLFFGPYYPPSYYYYPYYPRYYYPPPPQIYYDDPPPPPQAVPEPQVRLENAPEFIFSPELDLFVSVGVPYDLVYDGRNYYNFSGGYWYRGRNYNGPWELVTVSNIPTKLLKHRIDQIRYQRDLEMKRYETMGEHYNGQFHRP